MKNIINMSEIEIKTAVGHLLLRADALTKRCLTAFVPSASRTVNYRAFNQFNLEILEACAEFIGIGLADPDDNKIFTKESLINRILHGIRALLPSKCSECSEQYIVEFDSETPPLFCCYMCFQGSHDCKGVKSKHEAMSSASIILTSGHVWLCCECLSQNNPVKLRKSKSKHTNSKTTPHMSRLQTGNNSQIHSPADNSPGPLEWPRTPDESAKSKTLLNRDLQEQLHTELDVLSKKRICKKYKSGKCPHGLRGNKEVNGNKCAYEHPKRCFKFCGFGTKKKHGCSKGDSCEFYHPELCKFSVQKRICTNTDCTFVHLKGTKRKETDTKTISKHKLSTRPTNPKSKAPKAAAPETQHSKSDHSSSTDHFLELKGMVEAMQSNFQQQIASIRAALIPVQSKFPYYHPQMMNTLPPFHPGHPPGISYIPPSSC